MIMATASLGVKGNHIAQSSNQRLHRAPLWRNTTSDCHCRGTKPAVQALAIGASGTQQMRRSNQETFLYRIGQEKTPKGEIRLRARRYGARAHRKLASALLSRNSNAQHRSQFESKRSLGRLDLCCSRYFRFCHALVLALCAPKQVLCRFSSAAPRTACKLQLRSHAQHAGPQCLNQLRKQLRKRLFPALSALSSP
jgi:hypothetical protein